VDSRAERLVEGFGRLSPADQELVLALVDRLVSGEGDKGYPGYDSDVPFMDFES
jgi:hypothetical protein